MYKRSMFCPLMVALITALTPCISAQSDLNSLAHSQREFSFDLFRVINKEAQASYPNNNILVSPYTVYRALLLVYFGARSASKTEEELRRVLRLEWAARKSQVVIAYRHSDAKLPEFASGIKFYFDKKANLSEQVSSIFVDELESIDFSDMRGSIQIVNNWIANVTRNEKSYYLGDNTLSDMVLSLLSVGVANFKGRWAEQFDPKATKREIFYSSVTKQSFVQMMHKRGSYNYALDEDLGAYVLQIPYEKSKKNVSEISMVIILPPFTPTGLDNVVAKLTSESLHSALVRKGEDIEVDISLPKFELEIGLYFEFVFRTMGINSIFDDSADLESFFSNINLQLRNVFHQANIRIDEFGGSDELQFRSTFDPAKFECNHPFVYLLYDQTAKIILLAGIYRSPVTD